MIRSATIPIVRRKLRHASRGEQGYAMLLVMFMATVMLLMASAVAINIKTEGRRQREEELAWRGNQYVRAIKLYYQKNGRWPKNLEDLTKYVIDQPRYIRKAYTDPMNTDDGSWRLIYLGPGGTLINGVIHKTWYAGGVLGGPQPGQPPGAGMPGSPVVGGGTAGGTTTTGPTGGTTQPPGQQPDPNQSGAGQGSGGTGNGQIGSGPMFGGQLVGIASTVKQPSIRVFDGGVTYFQWEFICDPTKPGNICNTTGIGTMPGAPPTTPPTGTGTGTPPPQNPPAGPGGPGGLGTNPQQIPQ
jgi:type II secretory pathway pseudopilin PulG